MAERIMEDAFCAILGTIDHTLIFTSHTVEFAPQNCFRHVLATLATTL